MEKGKIRISPKLMALLLGGAIALTPITGLAVTDNSYNEGTFVKWIEQSDEYDYGIYIVKEKDNLSRISEKICSHFKEEITTKYWPALAYLNNYPRIILPGDIIRFPKNFDDLVELNEKLEKKGWTSKYKQTNKVYGKKRIKISMEVVGELLYDIYGEELGCIDPDLMNTYLKVTGLDKKYELRDFKKKTDNNKYQDLTEYIPSVDEIKEYQEAHKVKIKK